ncbi:sugar ABC transporter ATP-binding protein [uncultured Aeromicrobium sp.]|uniref:sugar ABC transporter ATP-binding protein n=1 Tax=uncultured Aeromicrobium sp. TaxID=337820 RepID=UPI0025D53B20|nr:sugar ABC transporter ATP-binding protein [uncultured Aeromicrobium sp.]
MAEQLQPTAGFFAEDPAVLVEVRGVSKRFGGTLALDDVSVVLRAGEVHAFVGENGAGKSTLGKVVAGIYTPDVGEVRVRGERVDRWDPIRAQAAGVAMIAQELALVPELSVAQNVFLGIEEHRWGVLRGSLTSRYRTLEERVGFGLDADVPVADLSIADQQKVEILRALARDAKVIVMDEPTSSLSAQETERLHEVIAALCAEGCAVVYVSHFLDAVLEVSDRVTVLRDGVRVTSRAVAGMSKDDMIEAMLGRKLESVFPPKARRPASLEPVLRVESLSTDTGVVDATLTIGPGEVVGLLGLVGSGRSELARALFGADPRTGGTIWFDGRELPHRWSICDAVAAKMAFVPESRHHDGLVLDRSVRENVSLAHLRRFSSSGVLSGRSEKTVVRRTMEELEMRPLAIELPVGGFSGGNQQKALLGRWLLGEPKLMILDEPTRGVDVGAKRTIYRAIADMAARGMAVLVISSEHEEVLGLAHRAYLVSGGRTVAEVDPDTVSADEIVRTLFSIEDEE